MKNLYEEIKNKLPEIDTAYDAIRIVDPVKKEWITIEINKIEGISGACYELLERGESCTNCISYAAFTYMDTFVKIEYIGDKVILVTALPAVIEDHVYIIEMIKDITENNKIVSSEEEKSVSKIISELNQFMANSFQKGDKQEPLKNTNRNWTTTMDNVRFQDIDILILKNKIEELRNILNEIYVMSENMISYDEKLKVSQYLDELIVEYMRKITKTA